MSSIEQPISSSQVLEQVNLALWTIKKCIETQQYRDNYFFVCLTLNSWFYSALLKIQQDVKSGNSMPLHEPFVYQPCVVCCITKNRLTGIGLRLPDKAKNFQVWSFLDIAPQKQLRFSILWYHLGMLRGTFDQVISKYYINHLVYYIQDSRPCVESIPATQIRWNLEWVSNVVVSSSSFLSYFYSLTGFRRADCFTSSTGISAWNFHFFPGVF